MKLLVRNLNKKTEQELVQSRFETYGTVQYCTLVMDSVTGLSKGFGFVEMPNAGEAKAAMKNLNGYTLEGNVLRVKKAEPKPES